MKRRVGTQGHINLSKKKAEILAKNEPTVLVPVNRGLTQILVSAADYVKNFDEYKHYGVKYNALRRKRELKHFIKLKKECKFHDAAIFYHEHQEDNELLIAEMQKKQPYDGKDFGHPSL